MGELLVTPFCDRCGAAFGLGEIVSVRWEGLRRHVLCSRCGGTMMDRFLVVNRVETCMTWQGEPKVQLFVVISQLS